MKHILLLLFFGSSLLAQAQDYYWVGNSGSWSDLSHWATSSGGSEYHTELPGMENDVYLDENSFSLPNQNLVIDLSDVYCRSFITTGVVNSPTVTKSQNSNALRVFGDLILSEGLLRDFPLIVMSAEEDGTQVTTSGIYLGPNSNLLFGGEAFAEYELTDSVSVNQIGVSRGALITNGHPIHCTWSFQGNFGPPREVYLSTSNVYLHTLDLNDGMVFDADEATFYCTNTGQNDARFKGGDFQYGHVEFSGNYLIEYSNSFEDVIVHPGSDITLQAGSTQTAGQFTLTGTSDSPISIFSDEAGTQASLEQSSGEVNGNYLTLRDNAAIGGATFTADNSLDLGNNSGWNIIEDLPANYFWVNGSGSWTDLSHWATSSGGAEFHTGLPTPQDTVIIDANSFSEVGTLLINTEALMADLRMENVLTDVEISAEEPIHVFGDIIASGDVLGDFRGVYLDGAPGPNYVSSNGMYWGPQSELIMAAGGVYYLNDDLNVQALNVDGGAVVASGITLNIDWQIRVQSVGEPWLDLSGSTVNCNFWRPYDPDPNSYDLSGATFYCNNQFYGNELSYDEVYLSGNVSMTAGASFAYLNLAPGISLTLESGTTYEVDEMIADGTSDDPIAIQSSTEGEEAYFEGNMLDVTGYYLELLDNHAIGSATFTAVNSTLGSNVDGWEIPESVEEFTSSFKLYPNPAADHLFIESTSSRDFTVCDLFGREVRRISQQNQGRLQLDISDLASGTYVLYDTQRLLEPQRFMIK